jgi:hypothetical protein
MLTLSALACSVAGMLAAAGCGEQPTTSATPAAFELHGAAGAAVVREPAPSYEARLDEISQLASEGDVAGAAKAVNSLLADVEKDVQEGRTTAEAGLDVAAGAQQAVIDIDIDVHFGTNEKCDAQFNCTKAQQMCVTVTWHVEGVGGGRNCFNWAAQAQ